MHNMRKRFLLLITMAAVSLCGCSQSEYKERAVNNHNQLHEYDVISVYQYMKTETNLFGGVIRQEPRYCFTYIGEDGEIHQFDDFEHTEYGLWKLCVGDEDKYVIEDGFDTYRWLYLTKETLQTMSCKE